MPKKSKQKAKQQKLTSGKILVSIMVLLMGFVVASSGWGWWLAQPGPLTTEKTVVIESGSSVNGIAEQLVEEDVLKNALTLRLAARVYGLDNTLQAGEYLFSPNISTRTVLNKLATGDVIDRQITIPEGLTTEAIGTLLMENQGLVGDMPQNLAEGSLYPDTYKFRYGLTREALVARMQQRMEQEIKDAWNNRADNLPISSPEELVVLASIVEKESAIGSERPEVASVFVNRLKKGMKLQADPTVIYGASNYFGNIRRAHLREDHPYNTYIHHGLPPGPIANPGRDALQAAANPAITEHLYFVADGTGAHVFASTYKEHKENVKRYVKIYRQRYGKTKQGEE